MKIDKGKLKKILIPAGIVFGILFILYIVMDNIVMPWYVQAGKTTKVPDTVGMPADQAKKEIATAGLKPIISEYKTDKRYATGTVIVQNPAAESVVKFGRGVYLTISGGEELVEVPYLRGKSLREAAFNLERYGLKLGEITYEPSDEIFANTIIRQAVAPNSKVKSGSHIDVVVSQGKASDKHVVPDVTLKTLAEAEKILADGGFRIGKVTYTVNKDLLPNTVLEQTPKAADQVAFGQSIDLVVAQKEESSGTPGK